MRPWLPAERAKPRKAPPVRIMHGTDLKKGLLVGGCTGCLTEVWLLWSPETEGQMLRSVICGRLREAIICGHNCPSAVDSG